MQVLALNSAFAIWLIPQEEWRNTAHLPLAYESFLFHNLPHLATQQAEDGYFYGLFSNKKQKIVATFAYFEIAKQAYSPHRAPFGGLAYSPDLPLDIVYLFWERIENSLVNKGIKSLQMTLYPQIYASSQAQTLLHLWLKCGFFIANTDLNYHIHISEKSFESRLHLSKKRQLKKCQKANFRFEMLDKQHLAKAYTIIEQNRIAKQRPISLSYTDLVNLFEQFPQHFFLIGVWDRSLLISTCIFVRINSAIIYYFMPADASDYQHFSPSIYLLAEGYAWAKKQGYQLLDLGTSTAQGKENFGLMQFKQQVGAEVSLKIQLQKPY